MKNSTTGGSPSPDSCRPDAPADLEDVIRRLIDERVEERLAPIERNVEHMGRDVEHLKTQKMHYDTDVAWNRRRLDDLDGWKYSHELGHDHRGRDVA